MSIHRFKPQNCRVCGLSFNPVKWLSHRSLGYCSEKCIESTFEWWFAQCALFCVDHNIGPPGYTWDIDNCPTWRAMWGSKMTPAQAVSAHFSTQPASH